MVWTMGGGHYGKSIQYWTVEQMVKRGSGKENTVDVSRGDSLLEVVVVVVAGSH